MSLVKVLQPSQLSRNGNRQATMYRCDQVALEHVLERSGWCSLTVVNRLVVAICISDQHEASSAYPRVVHSYDTDAEVRADHCIRSVALVARKMNE